MKFCVIFIYFWVLMNFVCVNEYSAVLYEHSVCDNFSLSLFYLPIVYLAYHCNNIIFSVFEEFLLFFHNSWLWSVNCTVCYEHLSVVLIFVNLMDFFWFLMLCSCSFTLPCRQLSPFSWLFTYFLYFLAVKCTMMWIISMFWIFFVWFKDCTLLYYYIL